MGETRTIGWLLGAALACASGLGVGTPARGAEGGAGLYLLGFQGPQAGLLPPPGAYLKTDLFYYDAETSGALPFSNRITADIEAEVWGGIATALWMSEWKLLGGSVGVAAAIPVLRLDLSFGVASERVDRLAGRLSDAQQRLDDLAARLSSTQTALLGRSQTLATRADQLAGVSDRLANVAPGASERLDRLSQQASALSAGAAALAQRAAQGTVRLSAAAAAAGELSDLADSLASLGVEDHDVGVGDVALTPLLGWHEGNFHWSLAPSVFFPTGGYDDDHLANVGKNHWALDLAGGFTWLTEKTGQEVSVFAGYTINWENPATDYETGDELHVELALIQHLPWGVDVGAVGYYYDQVTDDRGGASDFLGGFQGRIYGAGPMLGWRFTLFGRMASLNARWYHEFGAVKRLEGDIGFVTFLMQL
jgi:hypothetical protein